MVEKPLAIIVPSYNNEQNYVRNLKSIFSQKYHNYRVLYFDDASTDNTYQLVLEYLQKHPKAHSRTTLYRSAKNSKQSCHKFLASRLCHDQEIMIFLDGDDWLKNNRVFQFINKIYLTKKPWVTYGNYEIYSGKDKISYPNFCKQVSVDVIKQNKYRKSMFSTSHLKTCCAWIYKQIPISHVTDYDGIFLPFSTDVAEMRALIELAGKRNHFISQILYVYNRINSNLYQTSSVKRRNNKESQIIREHIRDGMKPLKRLKKPLKIGLNLNKPMVELLPTIIRNPDLKDIDVSGFYYQEGINKVSDEKLEIALRYMINMGIDLFLFQIDQSIEGYNIVTPNSYYVTKGEQVIVVKLKTVTGEDKKGGYIGTGRGIMRMGEQFVLGYNCF